MKQIGPPPADLKPAKPLLIAPLGFRPNSLFYGFEAEISQLDSKLHNKKRNNIGSCSVLVTGLAGSGKTHIVRQYVYQCRAENKYPGGTFWVDARSRESCYRSFWDIGQAAALLGENEPANDDWDASSKFVGAVRMWLESKEGWLLIFDGLSFDSEEEISEFIEFVPDKKGNSIIYTSVDRTLAGRQRLLNPTSVKLQKMSPENGCQLLYKGLNIREPTKLQVTKAMEVFKHFDGLPLAIHAAAHALIAKGRALENYSPGLTDKRLAEPYLEIMQALRENSHIEAVNLIKLLSFFNHNVPVALLVLGRKALGDFALDIRSTDREDSIKTDLDNTVAILIKYGLVERTLQPYQLVETSLSAEPSFTANADDSSSLTKSSASNVSPRSERSRRDFQASANGTVVHALISASAPDANGPVIGKLYATIEAGTQTTPTSNIQPTTDSRPESSLESSSSVKSIKYNIDILRVHTVVQTVYRDDIRSRDREKYYWWLSVAVKLFSASYAVAHARISASPKQGLVRDYREFETQAAALRSHFPRREKEPQSLRPVREQLRRDIRAIRREIHLRSPTHSFDSIRRRVQVSIFERSSSTSSDDPETPTDRSRASTWSLDDTIQLASPIELEPHTISPGLESSGSWDVGYETENDSSALTTRRSSRSEDQEDINPIRREGLSQRRPSFLDSIFKPRVATTTKRPKDLGEWKPLPAPPSLSHLDARSVPSRRPSSVDERKARPISAGSEAEVALAAVHRASPPASRGGRIRSPSRPNSNSVFNDISRRPLEERNPNLKLSPLAAEFDPGAKLPTATLHHSRRASASPQLAQVALANAASNVRKDLPPLPVEESIAVTRRMPLIYPTDIYESPSNYNSLPQTQFGGRQLPLGYTSQPMSRDNSRESAHSLLSAPAAVPGSASLSASPHITTPFLYSRPGPTSDDVVASNLEFGRMGEWSATVTPITPTAPSMLLTRNIDAVQFGKMPPVIVPDARLRAEEYAKQVESREKGKSREGEKKKENR